jgi:hypothetical protein
VVDFLVVEIKAYKKSSGLRNYLKLFPLKHHYSLQISAKECKSITEESHVHCNFGFIANFVTEVI